MKYFKRLVFSYVLLAVGAIFLVACGSTTSDNGKICLIKLIRIK